MTSIQKKGLGVALLFLVLPLGFGFYYFSFQSGCLFDGKQGYGNLALASLVFALISFSLGLHLYSQKSLNHVVSILLMALVFVIPIAWWVGFDAKIAGTQTCHPF
jgi:hypothetical protein